MKVHELIEILEELDPDASVYVMSQQSWPFEGQPSTPAGGRRAQGGSSDR